jgi:RNA polymerase sigma-70 factor (ECF subfamily)
MHLDPEPGEAADHAAAEATAGWFATTHWSVVIRAGRGDEGAAYQALSQLCEGYWYPLYAFVRRQGHEAEESRDLVQGFFAHFIEKNVVGIADPERGRFRSFLLSCLRRYLTSEWRRDHAQRRGGFATVVSIDDDDAERRYGLEPADRLSPETMYDRRWALTLIERAPEERARQHDTPAKRALYEALRPHLTGHASEAEGYDEIARRLGMEPTAVRVAVHRLRHKYGACLRAQIAQTVADPAQVEEEMQALFAALRG